MSIYESCNVIRTSLVKANLHYFMNESPHSMWITIRKKHLTSSNSCHDNSDQLASHCMKNLEFDQLKSSYENMKNQYEMQADNLKEALDGLIDLKEKLDVKTSEVEEGRKEVQELKFQLDETRDELSFIKGSYDTLETEYATKLEETKTLKLDNRNQEKEIIEESRRCKSEVKYWKKQMGVERRKNFKLEKKLEATILSTSMKNLPNKCSDTCSSTNLKSRSTFPDSNQNLKYPSEIPKDDAYLNSPFSTSSQSTTEEVPTVAFSNSSSNSTLQQNFVCDRCGFSTKSDIVFKNHELIEQKIKELNHEARELLKNVPVDEQILTPEEVTTFGLDCREVEELIEFIKNVNKNC